MASVFFPNLNVDIYYSLVDGRVIEFNIDNALLYSEGEVSHPEWKDILLKFIELQELNIDKGCGLYSFVIHYKEKGLIK